MNAPELSICIFTYNSAHFLSDAISSVMRQGLEDYEIVIVDNASQDDTEALVRGLNNPYIRYFRNPENFGPHYSSKRCVAEARGKYIKYLCADDVLVDGVLLKQMEVLRRRPDVALVTCDLCVTDSKLREKAVSRQFPGECSAARMINLCLSGLGNYIGGPSSIMFRRRDIDDLMFDSSYLWVGDLRFNLLLLRYGAYVNIDDVGYLYRRHPNTDTAINCSNEMRMPEYFRLVEEFNWWNPLNCFQAIRRGSRNGREIVLKSWWRAFRPSSVVNALSSFRDVWRMRYGYLRSKQRELAMLIAASEIAPGTVRK
jgi:glycosyltransferase involved in cell wall biosynthesis